MSDFSKVIGYEPMKAELRHYVDVLKYPEKYEALGMDFPNGGLCLVGEPGVGKTLIAHEFIEASGCKSFIVRKAKADGDFIDQLSETYENAIEESAKAPVIILLDDVHAWSNLDRHHRNSEEFTAIQGLIDKANGHKVFTLATANDVSCMPDSLLRSGRLKLVEVEAPKRADAERIIKHYLSTKKNVSPDIDAAEIAGILEGKSCADLEAVIQAACLRAGYLNKKTVDLDDIVRATLRVVYDAPDSMEDGEDNPYMYDVAIHEAGHAVLAHLKERGVNLVSICRHTGSINGVTSSDRDPNYFQSYEAMQSRVMAILGGRAATEMIFGKPDVGANSDLHRAFNIVGRFVDNFCGLGFDCWEGECEHSSDELANRKEQRIFAEMEHYYQETKKVLIENRVFLLAIADELMEKKVLLRKDIDRIRSECGQ